MLSSVAVPIIIAAVAAGSLPPLVDIPLPIEMLAVVVASGAGALSARKDQLDLIGAIGIAVVCGLGGGLLRDIILQRGDVYLLNQPLALPISIASAAIVFVFPGLVEKPDRAIAILDIFAVGLFAVMGADKALRYDLDPMACVMMGFFTGVGGGMLRDVLVNRVPYIFKQGNFYAIAGLAGATCFVTMIESLHAPRMLSIVVGTAVTMLLRWVSLRYNIVSPTEVNLERMARPLRRIGSKSIETVSRSETPVRSEKALDERRERVQSEIDERRRQEEAARRKRRRELRRQSRGRGAHGS